MSTSAATDLSLDKESQILEDKMSRYFMDPKALSHLDPKQREAYDRVMGTAHEIHGTNDQMTTPADTSEPSILSNGDPLSDKPPSTPFDTTVGGISDSPSIDPPTYGAPDDPTMPSDPSPSIFTNNAAAPDPTQTASAPMEAPAEAPANASFFTNSPVPESADTTSPSMDLSSPSIEPVTPEADATVASDNLSNISPVTPYAPDASEVTNTAGVSMPQPFATQPLPSPAEVVQSQKKESSPLLRVLYIVGAVIFFAVYTVFWIKIFNLPFLF